MLKLSVIVPVYNGEKTIKDTLTSIDNAIGGEMEIIVIDDGSTDRSYSICKRFAENKDYIQVIHQNNQGVSSARNRGISEACGKWIAFVDADDVVDCELYQSLEKYMVDENDLIVFNMIKGEHTAIPRKRTIYKQKEFVDNMLHWFKNESFDSCCNKVYRRALVNEKRIIFDPAMKNNEDLFFNLEFYKWMDRIVLDEEKAYCYCCQNQSASNRYIPGLLELYLKSHHALTQFCVQKNAPNEVFKHLEKDIFDKVIYSMYQEMFKSSSNRAERKKKFIQMATSQQAQEVLHASQKDNVGNFMQRILYVLWKEKRYNFMIMILAIRNIKSKIS